MDKERKRVKEHLLDSKKINVRMILEKVIQHKN